MNLKRIILPTIVTAILVSYFIYKKHLQDETTRYITSRGGTINVPEQTGQPDTSKMSPVELAAWNGNYSKVRELILNGCDVPKDIKIRIVYKNTETIYNTKIRRDSGYVHYGKSSVTHYMDRDVTEPELEESETVKEYSIVHYTAMEADHKIAEILLKKGFDFSVYDAEGYAPVHIICWRFKYNDRGFPYLKLLADYGLDLNQKARDSAGTTAMEIAEKRYDDKLVAYIKKLMQKR